MTTTKTGRFTNIVAATKTLGAAIKDTLLHTGDYAQSDLIQSKTEEPVAPIVMEIAEPVATPRPRSNLTYITRLRNQFFSEARSTGIKTLQLTDGGDVWIKLNDAATAYAKLAMSESHVCIFNDADIAAEADRIKSRDGKL